MKRAQLVPALEGLLYSPLIYTYELPAKFMGCTNDSSYTQINYVRFPKQRVSQFFPVYGHVDHP